MKSITYSRNHLAAAGGVLLIAAAWIAGFATLVHVEEVAAAGGARTTVVRMAPIIVTAKRLPPNIARMDTIIVTAPRIGSESFAAATPDRHPGVIPAAHPIGRHAVPVVETRI